MSTDELRPEERELVAALRAIPPSPLRDRLAQLVSELVAFVAAPACAELQADGAPCTSAQASCDECRKVTALLEGLRRRLQAG
jgi:hypothetical protein